jgi:hypothetical protein
VHSAGAVQNDHWALLAYGLGLLDLIESRAGGAEGEEEFRVAVLAGSLERQSMMFLLERTMLDWSLVEGITPSPRDARYGLNTYAGMRVPDGVWAAGLDCPDLTCAGPLTGVVTKGYDHEQ